MTEYHVGCGICGISLKNVIDVKDVNIAKPYMFKTIGRLEDVITSRIAANGY